MTLREYVRAEYDPLVTLHECIEHLIHSLRKAGIAPNQRTAEEIVVALESTNLALANVPHETPLTFNYGVILSHVDSIIQHCLAKTDSSFALSVTSKAASLINSINAIARFRVDRDKYSTDIQAFEHLLSTSPKQEEVLHQFINNHPYLICPAYSAYWSKLRFGATVSDFVFVDAIGDYLLVEIERSTHTLFTKAGDPSAALSHACSQLTDWKRYIEDNLSTVQRELGLEHMSTNPRTLVVIGRSDGMTDENRRKLVTMENEVPRRKIMTYDDLCLNAKMLFKNTFQHVSYTASKSNDFKSVSAIVARPPESE